MLQSVTVVEDNLLFWCSFQSVGDRARCRVRMAAYWTHRRLSS